MTISYHGKKLIIPASIGPIIRAWKEEYWDNRWYALSELTKWYAIKSLLEAIYPRFPGNIGRVLEINSAESMYFAWRGEIMMKKHFTDWITIGRKHVSLLSSLHELGHILYGKDEGLAVFFSETLFRQYFPREYFSLQQKGKTRLIPTDATKLPLREPTHPSAIKTPAST